MNGILIMVVAMALVTVVAGIIIIAVVVSQAPKPSSQEPDSGPTHLRPPIPVAPGKI